MVQQFPVSTLEAISDRVSNHDGSTGSLECKGHRQLPLSINDVGGKSVIYIAKPIRPHAAKVAARSVVEDSLNPIRRYHSVGFLREAASMLQRCHPSFARQNELMLNRTTVAARLARSPPTKANRVQSPAGSPDFRKWKSCRTMPLVSGFSRGSPISPAPPILRRSIFASITLIGSQDLACVFLIHCNYGPQLRVQRKTTLCLCKNSVLVKASGREVGPFKEATPVFQRQ
ncbi:hypothetical protein PR048_021815 [Dryococelus australis]|uniref:Uncharacterized protein n=1 Tax=Dryococelus australis TaxID=614101 RepID=A0ABQ9GZB5_9NEOP|nr:hypothetical protein PR048_021815 [Dryococelus australis]